MAVPSVSGNGAPTSVSGPFRFSCTGKAVHAAREGPPGAVRPGAAVDLPYCEGLEVRRSAARSSEPHPNRGLCCCAVTLRRGGATQVLASAKTEGGARPEAPPDGRAPHRAPPVPPREPAAAQRTQNPRPAAPPHKPPVVIDLTTFTDRRDIAPACRMIRLAHRLILRRFQAAAGKIAGRMAANANAIMSALGGGDGGPPKR